MLAVSNAVAYASKDLNGIWTADKAALVTALDKEDGSYVSLKVFPINLSAVDKTFVQVFATRAAGIASGVSEFCYKP